MSGRAPLGSEGAKHSSAPRARDSDHSTSPRPGTRRITAAARLGTYRLPVGACSDAWRRGAACRCHGQHSALILSHHRPRRCDCSEGKCYRTGRRETRLGTLFSKRFNHPLHGNPVIMLTSPTTVSSKGGKQLHARLAAVNGAAARNTLLHHTAIAGTEQQDAAESNWTATFRPADEGDFFTRLRTAADHVTALFVGLVAHSAVGIYQDSLYDAWSY